MSRKACFPLCFSLVSLQESFNAHDYSDSTTVLESYRGDMQLETWIREKGNKYIN